MNKHQANLKILYPHNVQWWEIPISYQGAILHAHFFHFLNCSCHAPNLDKDHLSFKLTSMASPACWTFCKFSIDDDPERWWSSLSSLILDPLCLLTTKVVIFWRFINLCICNGFSSNFVSITSRWHKLTNLYILVGSLVRNLYLDINKVCKLYKYIQNPVTIQLKCNWDSNNVGVSNCQ